MTRFGFLEDHVAHVTLLIEGADGRTIADRLDVMRAEVRSHIQSILEKLHVDSRLAATTKEISETPTRAPTTPVSPR